MTNREKNLWQGIDPAVQNALTARDYRTASFAQELAQRGLDAGVLVSANKNQSEIKEAWIPGVEIFARKVYPQRHRGCFGEFVRRDEGILARIGLWPKQWSAARMFASTAKGFHVHPPSVPEGSTAADWVRRLFVDEPDNYSLRRYDDEQWDVMFFLQGRVEMILCDIRAGLQRRVMRFFVDGDNHRGNNNVGVVIPPGVAGPSLDGTQVSLADYRGKPVLLHFWATWCGVCRAEQGSIDALAQTLPVLSIASQSGRVSQVKQYADERAIKARVLVDENNALARSFNIHSYPTTFVLDANGVIRFSEVGYTTELGLRARMWLASLW